MRTVAAADVDAFGGFDEVRRFGMRDIDKGLRIAVNEREPGTLDLDHDAMALAERVGNVGHLEGDAVGLAGLEGDAAFEAFAEAAAERFAANELLIAAEFDDV